MHWLVSALANVLPNLTPPSDSQAFTRREAELRRRLERLEREVEVVQRAQADEEPRS